MKLIDDDLVSELMSARVSRKSIGIPAVLQGATVADGFRLQKKHTDAFLSQYGGDVVGAKLAGGSLSTMRELGLNGPFSGPLFSKNCYDSSAILNRSDFFICLVEAEIAFLIGENIDSCRTGVSTETVFQSVAAVIPSIEIADARFRDFKNAPPAAVLADLAFGGAWIRGESFDIDRRLDLENLKVSLRCNGVEVDIGIGTRSYGNPLDALAAHITEISGRGCGLKSGSIITTGSFTVPYAANMGETLEADFGSFGLVRVSFS